MLLNQEEEFLKIARLLEAEIENKQPVQSAKRATALQTSKIKEFL
jgi:hypothetical protein